MKKLNRNAFNEKLIHRYLFEKYYFSSKSTRNLLLPQRLHKYSINLVVPESNREEGYRADLYIYFKELKEGIPVEVKWSSHGLTKKNQREYLEKNSGFYVAIDKKNNLDSIDYIQIDAEDFQNWITKNISKLSRESINYQSKSKTSLSQNQFWLVFLRGSAHANFKKMIKQFPTKTFWAYTQNNHSLKNIFDIQKGDRCLFILGTANEGMGVSNNQNLSFKFSSWYLTEITEPYYMMLKGKKGTFFESGDISINKRRWPHFMDFNILDKYEGIKQINFGKRGELASSIAESVNYGSGAPAPLSRRQWETTLDKLRAISK
jgi:hypothetical protein